jgi:hypothetical protein
VRTRVICLAVIAVVLVAPAAARADADPASDTLYLRLLFVPYGNEVSSPAQARLEALLERADAAGKTIRVALILRPADLGGVPQLFGRPVEYARFLDAELQYVYAGPVLVVMPQGAGLAKGGRLVANKAVNAARPGAGGDRLASTAIQLVEALTGLKAGAAPAATTQGPATTVAPPTHAPRPRKNTGPGVLVIVAIVVVVLLVPAVGLVLIRRERRR